MARKRVKTAVAASGTTCNITFSLAPADGKENFHRAGTLDSRKKLTFLGNVAAFSVAAGPHTLTWWAAGDPSEKFSMALTGDVQKEYKDTGRIPPERVTSATIPFVAKASVG